MPLPPHFLLPALWFLIQEDQTPTPTPSPAHLYCFSLESSLFPSTNLIKTRSGFTSEKLSLTLLHSCLMKAMVTTTTHLNTFSGPGIHAVIKPQNNPCHLGDLGQDTSPS